MGTSFHKGDASRYLQSGQVQAKGSSMQVFLGHVLEIIYEDPVPGVIRVKLLSVDRAKDEEITRVAFPVDRNIVKYPLPGELVFVLNGLGSDTIKDRFGTQLYYITTITSNNSITFNSNPYYSSSETRKTANRVFTGDYETRFEKRLISYPSYKQLFGNKQVIERQKLKPLEGDFIIQSRFGSAIRFSSTGAEKTGLSFSNKIGPPGNPILMMSVGVKSNTTSSRVENINMDAASFYICSEQTTEIVLSSSRLRSHAVAYNLVDAITNATDATLFVDTPIFDEFNPSNLNTGGGPQPSTPSGPPLDPTDPEAEKKATYAENSLPPITMSAILIGDSQTPYIARRSKKAKTIGPAGQKNLHLGGKNLAWLVNAVKTRQTSPAVNYVVICIGTNGGFNKKDDIAGLFSTLRTKFPNAQFLAVKGSWGWGGNSKKTEDEVNAYYDLFQGQGASVIKTPIGKVEPHNAGLVAYEVIGAEIDALIR